MPQDRVVKAILKADVSGLVNGMRQAQKATKEFAADAKESAGKNKSAWQSTGQGMLVAGAAIAGGVALGVKAFMDFDAAMSEAQAGTMATGASLTSLREAAIDAGAKTSFSATEAAQAITAMGKAGVSTKDILGGGLTGALDLAAAGQLDVAQASEIAATAMNQFGLEGKDIPHVADLLAAGAGKAMGSVQDLAGALKYTGPVAKGLGVSIEETTGTLAMFAQQGIIGEQAGTSLRGVLLTLTSPSGVVAKKMEELGINVYDASGNFIGLQGAAGELQAKLGPLDNATRNAALGQIFGNEQVTAARVLYEGGAGAVAKWTASVDDAGFAARQAAMLTDNLKGDVERLGGSLSSVLIKSGSGANGMLRLMTQELQGAVDLYGSAPVPIQQGATALGAVAAAALLTAGGLLVLAPRIIATKAALADMGRTGALLSGGLSKAGTASRLMGGPLVVATLALGYFAKQAQESKGRVDELASSLDAQTGAVTDNTRSWVAKNLSESGALSSAKTMGVSVADVTDAVLGNSDALARVNAALDVYGKSLAGNMDPSVQIDAMNTLRAAIGGGNDELNRGVEQQKLMAEAADAGGDAATGAAGKTGTLTAAQTELASETQKVKDALDAEVQALQDAGLVVLSTRSAQRALIDAQVAATEALTKNGKGLDINKPKQRENAAALDAQSSAALNLAKSIYAETGSEEKMRLSLVSSRAALVATGIRFGMTKGEANKYADSVLKIPAHKMTKVEIDKAAAQAKIQAHQAQINAIRGKTVKTDVEKEDAARKIRALQQQIDLLRGKTISITTMVNRIASGPGGPGGLTKADGGYIIGPGTTTSDSILARLSNKEYVVKAAAVAKYGVNTFDRLNSMRFAAGGYVGPRTSPSSTEQARGPLVNIEHMEVRDEAEAARRIETSQRDAATLYNLAGV